MQNKLLAQLVLQKMKEKKEEQMKNMPHYRILQLQTTFEYQRNLIIKNQIGQLQKELSNLQNTLSILEERSQQLQYTGKRNLPRIIVKPEFIASEKLEFKLKDFYRKLSNTFLRMEIFRNKKMTKSEQVCNNLTSLLDQVSRIQKQCRKKKEQQRIQTNGKRKRLQKENLRLQNLNEQIEQLKNTIRQERQDNIIIVEEYQLKKGSIDSRKQRLVQIQNGIQQYKRKIEQEFAPVVYREHLAKISTLQLKNQFILQQLRTINNQISNRSSSSHSKTLYNSKKQQYSQRKTSHRIKTQSLIGISSKRSNHILNLSTLDLTNDKASLNISNLLKIDSQQSPIRNKMRLKSEESQFCSDRRSIYGKFTNYINENIKKQT